MALTPDKKWGTWNFFDLAVTHASAVEKAKSGKSRIGRSFGSKFLVQTKVGKATRRDPHYKEYPWNVYYRTKYVG